MEERIRLTDICEPAMKEGRYEVEIIENTNVKEKDNSITFRDQVDMVVTSRRFRLQPDEIYSVYPPKNSSGEYTGCMPHIVLNRSTIPWERRMFPGDTQKSCPWLMLLLLKEGEPYQKKEMSIKKALGGVDDPLLYMGKEDHLSEEGLEKEGDTCTVLDISADFAATILPSWEEAKLLSHGRLVTLENKVTDASVKDGWFSCVIANRYVRDWNEEVSKYTACLVSIKGLEELLRTDNLKDRKCSIGKAEMVRLFVLYEWKFDSTVSPYSFSSIICNLKAGTLGGTVKGTVTDENLKDILERGYYPVNHKIRDGSKTVSWYRGPLLPQCELREPFYCHVFSDQLSKYDPDIGMMDMSYASAWQLGRMLAFQNQSLCKVLIRWRFENYRRAAQKKQEQDIKQVIYQNGKEKAQQQSLEALLMEQCKTIMENEDGKEEKKSGNMRTGEDGFHITSLESPEDMIKDGIAKETYFQDLSEEQSSPFPKVVKDFILESSLLYHVPFWYLVPDSDMLKEEEIRFFWLDSDWVLRLIDGVCSIGRNASIDYQHDRDMLEKLFYQCMEENGSVRRERQGIEDDKKIERRTGNGEFCYTGFLLRSVLVKDFRGLEFQAYSEWEDGKRLETLRLDTLGGNVLLGIFRGEMKRLVIGQPPEGLHLGFEWMQDAQGEKGVKYLRRLADGIENEKEAEIILKENGRLQCVDIKRTRDSIAGKLGATINSAGFALEMIQNANSGVFRIGV